MSATTQPAAAAIDHRDGSLVRTREHELAEGTALPKGFLEDHHLDNLETWLDDAFALPGTNYRFGLDGVIGLVPVVGDLATTGMSAVFIADALKFGARKRTIAKMAGYVALDFTIGAIPLVGDAFDFLFKSNRKNLALLREEKLHLAKRAKV